MARCHLIIRPTFWIIAFLLGWMIPAASSLPILLIWVAVIFSSVLLHELGHALAFLLFGQPCIIELNALGGLTQPQRRLPGQGPLAWWKMLVITLAGPLAGIGLIGVALLLGGVPEAPSQEMALWPYTLNITVALNILWTAANLLPILPLDGGQVVRHLLGSVVPEALSLRITLLWSALCAGGVAILLGVVWGAWIPVLLLSILALQNGMGWWSSRGLRDADLHSEGRLLFEQAMEHRMQKEYEAAEEMLRRFLLTARDGLLYLSAHEQLAELAELRGDLKEAFAQLHEIKERLRPEWLLFYHELALAVGNYQEVVAVGDQCFRIQPVEQVAFRNAVAHAALAHATQAFQWFEAAWENGLPNPDQALLRSEFDSLRGTAAYHDALIKLREVA